jgi:cell division protease FtsH
LNKRWRNVGLYVLLVVVVIVVGTAFLDRPDPATAARTLRYSDFVESVQEDQVSRVLLSPDRGTAQIVETDGRRAEVNLAPDKDLLKMLTDHNVDIAVQPSRQPGAWQQAATSLIFPLLLLGGLFFLFRRAHNDYYHYEQDIKPHIAPTFVQGSSPLMKEC